MKTVVIFKSKSGFTRKYAQWIAEELRADLVEHHVVKASELERYDTVIYGGGLYAVGINGLREVMKGLESLENKRVIVFATGVSPLHDGLADEILRANFSPEQQDRVRFFYLRGGFDAGKLTASDRILMALLKLKLRLKPHLNPDEKGMLAAYDHPLDFTRRENLAELLDCVRRAESAPMSKPPV